MKHAEKMVSIPEETAKNLQTTDTKLSTNKLDKIYDSVLARLDQEMNEIRCFTAHQNECEKWNAYSQVIERYLRLIKNENQTVTTPNFIKNGNVYDSQRSLYDKVGDSINKSPDHNIDQSVIDSVPKVFQSKAKLLYRRLKNMPDNIIIWDNIGVVSIEGSPMPGSNIIDLLNDAMRSRKNEYAIGRDQFARVIHRGYVPREYKGNKELLAAETVGTSTPTHSTRGRRLIIPDIMPEGSSSMRSQSASDINEGDDFSSARSAKSHRGSGLLKLKCKKRWLKFSFK